MIFPLGRAIKIAACAKSPAAIPSAIIEPGFVAVAQAQAGSDRTVPFQSAAVDAPMPSGLWKNGIECEAAVHPSSDEK